MIIRIALNNNPGSQLGEVSDDHRAGHLSVIDQATLADISNVMPNRDALFVIENGLTQVNGYVEYWRVEFNEHNNRKELVIKIKES